MTQDTNQKVKLIRGPGSVQPCPARERVARVSCHRGCLSSTRSWDFPACVLVPRGARTAGGRSLPILQATPPKAVLEASAASPGWEGSPSPCPRSPDTPPRRLASGGMQVPSPHSHPLFTYPQKTLSGQAGENNVSRSPLRTFPGPGFGRDPQGSPEPLSQSWGVEISGTEEISGSHS